jgi:CHAD domain-containing protein
MKSQPLSRFALAQARARFKRLCATFNRSAKRPEKPESAHDLRVSLRRFLQCLEMFGGLFPSKPAEKLRKRSRKLLDLCGAKRDYDVALQVLTDAGLPPHSSTVMKLRERQAEESHRLARRLRKRLASKKTPQRWKKQLHAAKRPGGDWKCPPASLKMPSKPCLP